MSGDDRRTQRRQRDRDIEALLEAARWVNLELRGSLGAFEHELRVAMGNTNFHCLSQRSEKLALLLKCLGK